MFVNRAENWRKEIIGNYQVDIIDIIFIFCPEACEFCGSHRSTSKITQFNIYSYELKASVIAIGDRFTQATDFEINENLPGDLACKGERREQHKVLGILPILFLFCFTIFVRLWKRVIGIIFMILSKNWNIRDPGLFECQEILNMITKR